MFPRIGRERRDQRFAELRRDHNIAQSKRTPADRWAAAEGVRLLAISARRARSVSGPGTDETIHVWRALRASFRR